MRDRPAERAAEIERPTAEIDAEVERRVAALTATGRAWGEFVYRRDRAERGEAVLMAGRGLPG
ncbi:hypothetical protein [Actinoplanes sp. NPDC051411]|uniref:hypothetical protein n=1 Tax=Actinoplanes sp. NPDC051411 TaxID=3155522 RepID=UPI00341E555E